MGRRIPCFESEKHTPVLVWWGFAASEVASRLQIQIRLAVSMKPPNSTPMYLRQCDFESFHPTRPEILTRVSFFFFFQSQRRVFFWLFFEAVIS